MGLTPGRSDSSSRSGSSWSSSNRGDNPLAPCGFQTSWSSELTLTLTAIDRSHTRWTDKVDDRPTLHAVFRSTIMPNLGPLQLTSAIPTPPKQHPPRTYEYGHTGRDRRQIKFKGLDHAARCASRSSWHRGGVNCYGKHRKSQQKARSYHFIKFFLVLTNFVIRRAI